TFPRGERESSPAEPEVSHDSERRASIRWRFTGIAPRSVDRGVAYRARSVEQVYAVAPAQPLPYENRGTDGRIDRQLRHDPPSGPIHHRESAGGRCLPRR